MARDHESTITKQDNGRRARPVPTHPKQPQSACACSPAITRSRRYASSVRAGRMRRTTLRSCTCEPVYPRGRSISKRRVERSRGYVASVSRMKGRNASTFVGRGRARCAKKRSASLTPHRVGVDRQRRRDRTDLPVLGVKESTDLRPLLGRDHRVAPSAYPSKPATHRAARPPAHESARSAAHDAPLRCTQVQRLALVVPIGGLLGRDGALRACGREP